MHTITDHQSEVAVRPLSIRAGAIGLVLTMIVTMCGGAVGYGVLQGRVDAMDSRGTTSELKNSRELQQSLREISDRLARIEGKLDADQADHPGRGRR